MSKRRDTENNFGLSKNGESEIRSINDEFRFLKSLIRQQAHHNKLIAKSTKRIHVLYQELVAKVDWKNGN